MATGVELATAYVSLSLEGSSIGPQIRKAFSGVDAQASRTGASAGKKLGSSMGSSVLGAVKSFAAPIAAALGVGVLASFGKEAVTLGSDLEQSLGGAEAVFKSQFATIKSGANGAATALGLSKNAYLELATVTGASLKNKGLKDFTKQSQNLIQVGADLAAQYGGTTKEAVEALNSLLRGETDPIEKYGIAINQAAIEAEALRLGLVKNVKDGDKVRAATNAQTVAQRRYNEAVEKHGKSSSQALAAQASLIRSTGSLQKALAGSKGEITTTAKAQAALSLVAKQSSDAQGAFARESDTYAGKQQRLAATWENMKTQVGQYLLPVLTDLSEFFLKKGLPAIERFGSGVRGVFDVLFKGDYTSALSKAFGLEEDSGTVDFLFKIRDAAIAGFEKLKLLGTGVKGLFDLLVRGDYTGALSKAFGIEEDSGTVAALFRIRDGVISAYNAVRTFGVWVRDNLWPALKDGYNTIMPGLKKAFDIVTGGVGGADTNFRGLGEAITKYVIPFMAELINVYLPFIATQIRIVIEVVKAVYGAFIAWRDVMATVTSFILQRFAQVARTGADMLAALSKVPGFGWAKDAADKLRNAANGASELSRAISNIPGQKRVDVLLVTSGKVDLGNGVKVDPGQFKARAMGGPVRAGQSYLVGEHRPEIFTAPADGYVSPKAGITAPPGIDYGLLGASVAGAMQGATFAVDARAQDRAIARDRNMRGRQ